MFEMLCIVFVVILINCCLLAYLSRKTRIQTQNNMNARVSAAMHEYFALSDHDVDF